MAKKKPRPTKAVMRAPNDGIDREFIDAVYKEAVRGDMLQCFQSAGSDKLVGGKPAVERFLAGLEIHRQTREKLITALIDGTNAAK